jgi:hypothetical protein
MLYFPHPWFDDFEPVILAFSKMKPEFYTCPLRLRLVLWRDFRTRFYDNIARNLVNGLMGNQLFLLLVTEVDIFICVCFKADFCRKQTKVF